VVRDGHNCGLEPRLKIRQFAIWAEHRCVSKGSQVSDRESSRVSRSGAVGRFLIFRASVHFRERLVSFSRKTFEHGLSDRPIYTCNTNDEAVYYCRKRRIWNEGIPDPGGDFGLQPIDARKGRLCDLVRETGAKRSPIKRAAEPRRHAQGMEWRRRKFFCGT
jgi:hypothetical protein